MLVFCDETADVNDPIAALAQTRNTRHGHALSLAVLVGPEGGFAQDERAALLKLPNAVRLSSRPPHPRPPPPPAATPPPRGGGRGGGGGGGPRRAPRAPPPR